MEVKGIYLDDEDLTREESLPTAQLLQVEIKVGHRVYRLSEDHGGLGVNVDGRLWIFPESANVVRLDTVKL